MVGQRIGLGRRLWKRNGSCSAMSEELEESLGHLGEGECVVKGRHGYVAAVDNACPGGVRVDARAVVEAAEGVLPGGGSANGARSEAGS